MKSARVGARPSLAGSRSEGTEDLGAGKHVAWQHKEKENTIGPFIPKRYHGAGATTAESRKDALTHLLNAGGNQL
jgi:hypothetical protein